MKNLADRIGTLINAKHPLIYLKTEEELEALDVITEAVETINDRCPVFTYDEAEGLRWINENRVVQLHKDSERKLLIRIKNQIDAIGNFYEAMKFIRDISSEHQVALAVLSAETTINEQSPSGVENIRMLKNVVNDIKQKGNYASIFFISESFVIPPLLEQDIIVFKFSYPNRSKISEILDEIIQEYSLIVTDRLRNELISALQGLTYSEIENLLYIAISDDGSLDEKDIDFFMDYKKQKAEKNPIVEFVDLRGISTDVGGLKNLKEWLNRKNKIFRNLDKAIENGVDLPKGVLLVGMPGCGKSLTAKYAGKLMNLPLLRLDMGRVMGPYLGQSEENIRKAILTAESIAPSILWIDELEKALSGIGDNSNDTLTRIFGTLLTWMQEKKKAVFLIATANDISGLPAEFLRKGRFDEIFFVDFPDRDSMREIFKIHLKNRKKDPNSIDLDRVLDAMKVGYSGADIEAIVSEAVENAFIEGKNSVSTEDILNIIRSGSIKPMSEVLKDKVDALREAFKKYSFKPAN